MQYLLMVLVAPLSVKKFVRVVEHVTDRSTVRGLYTDALGSDQGVVELVVECSKETLDDLVKSLEQLKGVSGVAYSDTEPASKGMAQNDQQQQAATAVTSPTE